MKMKKSKRKQQRYQQEEIPFESDAYLIVDDQNNEHSHIYYHDHHYPTHDSGKKFISTE